MNPYIGEIRLFAGTFAPAGWAFCHGQLLPIADFETVFILIGTTYGGDGQNTFALPDLRGRAPVHQGVGPGLSLRVLGSVGGTETETVSLAQLPAHGHPLVATSAAATTASPSGTIPASAQVAGYAPAGADAAMPDTASTGGGQPFDNRSPALALNFIFSLYGIFPSPT